VAEKDSEGGWRQFGKVSFSQGEYQHIPEQRAAKEPSSVNYGWFLVTNLCTSFNFIKTANISSGMNSTV